MGKEKERESGTAWWWLVGGCVGRRPTEMVAAAGSGFYGGEGVRVMEREREQKREQEGERERR